MSGFIKLSRSIRKWAAYKDSDTKSVWIECLLLASFTPTEVKIGYKTIHLERGQFLSSRLSLAKTLGISDSKIERCLKWLKSEHQIEQQTFSKYRIITIVNYDEYQESEQQNEQQVNSKWTASEQQVNTSKNVKNGKKGKEIIPPPISPPPLPEWIPIEDWNDWMETRKRKKIPTTERAVKIAITKLDKLRQEGHSPSEVLQYSILGGYPGLYAPTKIEKQNDLLAGVL